MGSSGAITPAPLQYASTVEGCHSVSLVYTTQHYTTRACTRRAQTSAKVNLVLIRSPYSQSPDTDGSRLRTRWLPKFSRNFLVHLWYNFHNDPISFSRHMRKIVEKNAISHNVEESCKKLPGSGGEWRPKFNQFFLVHWYICSKIFMKIRSVVFT